MGWISHDTAIAVEVTSLTLEFFGAFMLAKEVWDRPIEVIVKKGLERVAPLGGVKVDGKHVDGDSVESFFASKSAWKARWGFFLVAVGIGGKLFAKLASTFGH